MLDLVIFLCYLGFLFPLIKRASELSRNPGTAINWRPGIAWAVSGVAGLTIVLALLSIYTEALWFDQFGFTQRFWKVIWVKWTVFLGFGIVAYAFLKLNFRPLRSISLIPPQLLKWLPVILAVVLASVAQGRWETILLYANRVAAGLFDPVFGKDVGFYFFSVPFQLFLSSWIMTLLVATFLIAEASYIPAKFINLAVRHGTLLWSGILVVIVWKVLLAQYGLVYSSRGAVFGAGYADVHAQVLAYRIFAGLTFAAAVALLFAKTRKSVWITGGAWACSWLLVVMIYPGVIQYFVVRPNELEYERPFIENNIKFTRLGYGIDEMEEKEFIPEPLSADLLARNSSALSNVRLWDSRALLDTYKQLQEIRLYYEFSQIDIDRYWISGEYTQVMLAARELSQSKLPAKSRTWINQRFKYTHGYGVCLSPVSEFTSQGAPSLLIKDMPPESGVEGFEITRPEIYYGEQTWEPVYVRTETDEFDYPKGDQNVYCQYAGDGGVELSGFVRKLAFALKGDGIKLLLSKYLTDESRIMFNRQIGQRVARIAPFLRYDADPYLVISDDGKLFWIWDAYTTSRSFPYSEPFVFQRDTVNYIRNSVKVLLDAYNGSVKFFVFDTTDPVIRTYSKAFPDLFSASAEFPADLRSHLRYPEDLLSLHAEVYATYHMLDPDVFYNREDLWQIAREKYIERAQPVVPYYVIASLLGELEFVQMVPFTPLKKDNLIAWLAGRCDGEQYGKLLAYKFPKESLTYGPMQIEARIDQDAEISSQLTLWGQGGSEVIRGNTLVIPLENSLLYVEPLYLQATGSRIPELRKVVVSSGDRLVWADRFEEALQRLVSGIDISEAEGTEKVEKRTILYHVRSALERFRRYKKLSGSGGFEEAGEMLRGVESELKKAAKLKE
jgi:uncharacterized membrane protein (UPF0182 family)